MTNNKKRAALIVLYRDILDEMSIHGEAGDYGTLFDKLVYMTRNPEGGDHYYVPEGFNFEGFKEDLKTLD